MFFRRQRVEVPTFEQRIDKLRAAGFAIAPLEGALRVTRGPCAIDLKEQEGAAVAVCQAGIVMGAEIGALVDGGYQKFFRAPSGKQKPALADELKALHDFEEDLWQALGRQSYYNQSLGTVSTLYLYDRVQDRDRGVPRRAWET
ncbi:MAG TPA: hypothetical protein VGE89_06530 [Bryobacteraceae bacterium]|jgi:hypothetical protein